MAGALEGIKVVELASVVLGPLACQMLGDLGADVIKLEPLSGDSNRNLGPYGHTENMRSLYLACNRNKRSIAVDLKTAAGKSAAQEIIKSADVLVHNYRPGAVRRLGLDYQAVKQINPAIVYCATQGFSSKGPKGEQGALDDTIQAASGMAALQAQRGEEPGYLPTVIADKTTAYNVVQAVLAALFHKERTGEGQQVEVPMFETMVSFLMVEHLWGQSFVPASGKSGYPRLLAEHRRPYRTKDGFYLALLPYWDKHWDRFCELSGHPELLADERFIGMRQRLANIDETYRITGEIVAERSLQEWLELLHESSVPMMPINQLDDLIEDPQLTAAGFWHEFDHPSEGRLRMPGPTIEFSKTPASIRALPPHLGEHTLEILREAQIPETKIQQMLEAGIIECAP